MATKKRIQNRLLKKQIQKKVIKKQQQKTERKQIHVQAKLRNDVAITKEKLDAED